MRHSPRMNKFRVLIPAIACVFASASPSAESPVRSFSWLSGHWCLQEGARLTEEFWLPDAGDVALGVSRTIESGKTTSVEFMRIETRNASTNFIATLEGQPPTPFELTQAGDGWVRFENPRHDFPRRVAYRRTPAGLHAEIAGPGRDGKEQIIPFEYRHCVD